MFYGQYSQCFGSWRKHFFNYRCVTHRRMNSRCDNSEPRLLETTCDLFKHIAVYDSQCWQALSNHQVWQLVVANLEIIKVRYMSQHSPATIIGLIKYGRKWINSSFFQKQFWQEWCVTNSLASVRSRGDEAESSVAFLPRRRTNVVSFPHHYCTNVRPEGLLVIAKPEAA